MNYKCTVALATGHVLIAVNLVLQIILGQSHAVLVDIICLLHSLSSLGISHAQNFHRCRQLRSRHFLTRPIQSACVIAAVCQTMRYLRRDQNVLTLITVFAQNVYTAIGKSLADRNVYPRGDSHLSTWSATIEYQLQTK